MCAALKPVYQAATEEEAALEALAAFEASELGRRYPAATQDLHRCLGPVYTVPGVPTDVKPWVLWRVFYLEPVVAGWGSSIVWLVLWLSAWSVSSGGGV